MKKSIFVFTISLASVFTLNAQQYIFNNCGNRSVYGDSLTGFTTTHDTTGIGPGPSGANLIWNYSAGVTATMPLKHYYSDPAVSDSGQNFTKADLADLDDNGYYNYYGYGYDSITYYGDSMSSNYNRYAWDPMKKMICPFSFGNSYSDFYSSHTPIPICPCHHTYTSRVVTYDSYGSLHAPMGMYNGAVRVKVVENTVDTAICVPITIGYYKNISYTWYNKNNGQPVFAIRYFIDTVNSYSNKFVESFNYDHLPATITGISEPDGNRDILVNVSPNPSHGKINLIADGAINGVLEIYNALGAVVYGDLYFRTDVSGKASLNPNLQQGIYLLSITSGQRRVSKKIVVE